MSRGAEVRSVSIGFTCIVVVLIILFFPKLVLAQSDNNVSRIYSPDSKPYGLTYGEWTAKWWQWLRSIPYDRNPFTDNTGKQCAEGQNGPVWFLPGGKGDIRSCTVPAGKSIFIAAMNVLCSYATDKLKSESELRQCAKEDQDKVTTAEITVDGINIPNIKQQYRVQSPLFNLTFANPDVFGSTPGSTFGLSDGYWVMLKPLSPGIHDIKFKGVLVDFTNTASTKPIVNEATYRITIKP